MSRRFFALLSVAAVAAAPMPAWWDAVHKMITAAALASQPQRIFGDGEAEKLINEYCLYPDTYRASKPEVREGMRAFCEFEDRSIHHLSWSRPKDLALIQHLRGSMKAALRDGDAHTAARYAGTLAHVIEDATCPSHALIPFDSPLDIIRDLLAPPPEKRNVHLHTVMETSAPKIDLTGRAPRVLEDEALLDSLYDGVRSTRAVVLDMARAAYNKDEKGMDPGRRQAALTGAAIVADALYSGRD